MKETNRPQGRRVFAKFALPNHFPIELERWDRLGREMAAEPPLRPEVSSPGMDGDQTVRVDRTLRIERAPQGLTAGQRVLGRYTLEAVLGRGGMAVVWRARDETLGETVALKFLPEAVARDEAAVEELKEETRRARRLTHPNIVRIHDFVQGEGMVAISMEYVDGDTLAKQRLEQPGKSFSVAALAPLVAQLCAALEYAHTEAKVVHRDLKPANLLVTRDGQLKVADFGIACSLTEVSTRLTGKAGRTSGTLIYVSPQQLLGESPSPADDIYALGATLYELLTGKPPFFRGDASSLILQVREKAPAPLAERRAELEVTGEPIPPEWEQTILACLAKAPQDRPQSAGEVVARLNLGEITKHPKDTKGVGRESSSAEAQDKNRKSKGAWLAGLAAVAALAVATFVFWPRTPAAESVGRIILNPPSVAPASTPGFVVTVDPVSASARLSLGSFSNVGFTDGKAVLQNLPDGEHELVVLAPGFQPFATRVTVKDSRGWAEARLVAAKGIFEITARPDTRITAVDAQGREARLGVVAAGGVLASGSLLTVGRYTLRLEHPDCVAVELANVELAADRVTKLTPVQPPLPGELRVFSVPTGAEVRVNGQAAGPTPATLKNQPSEQPLRVEVTLRGYRRAEQDVTLKPREVRTLNVGTLAAEAGGLKLRIANFGMQKDKSSLAVSVAGKPFDHGIWQGDALLLDGLEIGAQALEIAHPDYEPWRQTMTVRDGENAAVAVALVPKPAVLTLAVAPTVEYTLWANGRPLVVQDGLAAIPAGEEQALEVRAAGYKPARRTLTATPRETVSWEVTLEKAVLPQAGKPWENGLGMKFVPVPGTEVLFSIWDTRVQDYAVFVSATRREWAKPNFAQGPTHPAVNVSWDDAQAFCAWLTETERAAGRLGPDPKYRLPTDAEWSIAVGQGRESGNTPQEKDARLTMRGSYPWGTQWPPPQGAGNYRDETRKRMKPSESAQIISGYDDGYADTSPVGSFAANRHGLYDMGGNVWQWCEDYYNGQSGTRVQRGASFNMSGTGGPRSSWRNDQTPDGRRSDYGFRCVVAAIPETATTYGGVVPAKETARASGAVDRIRQPEVGQVWTVPNLGLVMQPIAAGTFTMGSPADEPGRKDQEGPQTRVTINRPYWLGKYEVRVGDFAAFVKETNFQTDADRGREMGVWTGSANEKRPGWTWRSPGFPQNDSHPVVGVSWDDAQAFCAWLTQRERIAGRLPEGYAYTLPTEAQWEYACRAGTTGAFAGELDAMGWSVRNSGGTTHPVGQLQPNSWGLHDMHGNVREWCLELYVNNLPGGSVQDYSGSTRQGLRTNRGGNWAVNQAQCRSASRLFLIPDWCANNLGFRLALAYQSAGAATAPAVQLPGAFAARTAGGNATAKVQPLEKDRPWTVPGLGMEMVWIKPGTFTMGSPDTEADRALDEGPQTKVTFTQGFWLGKYELTQGEWRRLMGVSPTSNPDDRFPVVQVSWNDVMEFCRKLTELERAAGRLPEGCAYTLPTEAQWEYACRAGTTGPYAGTGRLNDLGWYLDNSGGMAHPVGQKQPNAWGLYDMHGNVWELCADWYSEGKLPGGEVCDPAGPSTGARYVERGGSWQHDAANCRAARRGRRLPDAQAGFVGFRVALIVPPGFGATGREAVPAGLVAATAGAATPAPGSANAGLRRGLVLYFSFDQPPSNATVRDESGQGNNGTIVGARWIAQGKRGGAMQFSRSNTYVRVPNQASLNPAQITVAAWIKTSYSDSVWRRIVDKDWTNGFALSIGGDVKEKSFRGLVCWEVNRHSPTSDGRVDDGAWHLVTGTFDGTIQNIYIDGRLQTKRNPRWTGRVASNDFDLTIAGNRSNPDPKLGEVDASFDGEIDEVMIFNRALSGEEVQALLGNQP